MNMKEIRKKREEKQVRDEEGYKIGFMFYYTSQFEVMYKPGFGVIVIPFWIPHVNSAIFWYLENIFDFGYKEAKLPPLVVID